MNLHFIQLNSSFNQARRIPISSRHVVESAGRVKAGESTPSLWSAGRKKEGERGRGGRVLRMRWLIKPPRVQQ